MQIKQTIYSYICLINGYDFPDKVMIKNVKLISIFIFFLNKKQLNLKEIVDPDPSFYQ